MCKMIRARLLVFMFLACLTVASGTRADMSQPLRFIMVSDYQPPIIKKPHAPWIKIFPPMLREFGKFDPMPQFLIMPGDLVNGNTGKPLECPPDWYDRQWQHFLGIFKDNLDPQIALYPVVGNHDYHRYIQDGQIIQSGPEAYAKYMFPFIPPDASPSSKPYYSFQRGGTHFTIIATALMGVKKVNDYNDLVYGDQYQWLQQDLEAAAADPGVKNILVFGHHPFAPIVNDLAHWKGLDAVRQRIWDGLFVKYGVKAYIHGHWHFYDRSTYHGVGQIDVGGASALENPGHPEQRVNHYAIVDIDGTHVQVSIYLPGQRLYESYSLDDLRQGKLEPPHKALAKRYQELFQLAGRTGAITDKAIGSVDIPNTPAKPTNQTILLYSFDKETNGTVIGQDTQRNPITLGAGTKLVLGKFDKACYFNGEDSYLECSIPTFPRPSGRLAMWVNFDRIDSTEPTLFRIFQSNGLKVERIYRQDTPLIRFSIYDGANLNWYRVRAPIQQWEAGQWHHIQALWDAKAGVMQLVFDGKLVASGNLDFELDFNPAPTAFIGCDNNLEYNFSGAIDDLLFESLAK